MVINALLLRQQRAIRTFAILYCILQGLSFVLLVAALFTPHWRSRSSASYTYGTIYSCPNHAGLFNSCEKLLCYQLGSSCRKGVVVGLLVAAGILKLGAITSLVKVVRRQQLRPGLYSAILVFSVLTTALSAAALGVFSDDFQPTRSTGIRGTSFHLAIASTAVSGFAIIFALLFSCTVIGMRKTLRGAPCCDNPQPNLYVVQPVGHVCCHGMQQQCPQGCNTPVMLATTATAPAMSSYGHPTQLYPTVFLQQTPTAPPAYDASSLSSASNPKIT